MAIPTTNPSKTNPSEKELRTFGLVFGALIAGVFGVVMPWLYQFAFPLWPWVLASILSVLALLKPTLLFYINKVWLLIGNILGFINTRIVLGLLFYVLILPIGIIFRVLRKSNNYQFDSELTTYKKPSEKRPINHMEKPY
jgi:hypothetical protein